MDAMMEAAAPGLQIEVEALPETAPPENASEADLILRFEEEADVPDWLQQQYKRMGDDRKYLHTDAFAFDDTNERGTNFLFRAISAKHSQIMPQDPWVSVKPERYIAPQGQQNPMHVQQRERMRKAFAQSTEALVQKLLVECRFDELFSGASFDAMVQGVAYLKVIWHEDYSRDPLGTHKSDQQDQMARLRRLASEYAAGDWGDESGQYLELMHLSEYAIRSAQDAVESGDPRASRLQQLAAAGPGAIVQPYMIPEPERWLGAELKPVQPENMRLDWSRVTQPEQFYDGGHITEKTFMRRDLITQKWSLSLEESRRLGGGGNNGNNENSKTTTKSSDDPEDIELEDKQRAGEEIAVFERWDRDNHRMYIWASGLPRFLHTEIPDVTSRYFFPYVAIPFNRVAGRYHPVSYVSIGRKLQEGINQKLQDDDDARLAHYDRYAVDESIEDDALEALESCQPHKGVKIRGAEDISKKIYPIKGSPYDPRLGDIGGDMKLLEIQLGSPVQSSGLVGQAHLATEVQVANDHMMAQSAKDGIILSRAMQIAATMIADYAISAMPQENVMELIGDGAVWPVFDRESLWRSMRLTIEAGGSQRANRRQNIENWQVASEAIGKLLQTKAMAQQAGYDLNVESLIGNVLSELDIRDPVEDILMPMGMPGLVGPGGPGMPMPSGIPMG